MDSGDSNKRQRMTRELGLRVCPWLPCKAGTGAGEVDAVPKEQVQGLGSYKGIWASDHVLRHFSRTAVVLQYHLQHRKQCAPHSPGSSSAGSSAPTTCLSWSPHEMRGLHTCEALAPAHNHGCTHGLCSELYYDAGTTGRHRPETGPDPSTGTQREGGIGEGNGITEKGLREEGKEKQRCSRPWPRSG